MPMRYISAYKPKFIKVKGIYCVIENENKSPLNKPVFITSSALILCLLIFAAGAPEQQTRFSKSFRAQL